MADDLHFLYEAGACTLTLFGLDERGSVASRVEIPYILRRRLATLVYSAGPAL